MTTRSAARAALGAAAVLSEAEAVALLPVRDSVARGWLRDAGLVREHPTLGRIVVWAEVLEAIRGGDGPAEEQARGRSGYARAGLRRR